MVYKFNGVNLATHRVHDKRPHYGPDAIIGHYDLFDSVPVNDFIHLFQRSPG